MAASISDTGKGDGLIPALREQILDNAVILYPKLVEDHQNVVLRFGTLVRPVDIFKIITVTEWDGMPVQNSARNQGVKAVLLGGGGYPGADLPKQLMVGPMAQTRSDALRVLLKVTEELLDGHQYCKTEGMDSDSVLRCMVCEVVPKTGSVLVDGEVLQESTEHATER